MCAYFHGEGRQRRSTGQIPTIFSHYNIQPPDEATSVPLYDVSSRQLSHVSIKSVLYFVYYHSGRRRPPSNVTVSDSIVTKAEASQSDNSRNVSLRAPRRQVADDERLLDSDEDSDTPINVPPPPATRAKRPRSPAQQSDRAFSRQRVRVETDDIRR